jgi:hypothetical protein
MKKALEIEFNAGRWEAVNPRPSQRAKLHSLGWVWDLRQQVWFTQDEKLAEAGGLL